MRSRVRVLRSYVREDNAFLEPAAALAAFAADHLCTQRTPPPPHKQQQLPLDGVLGAASGGDGRSGGVVAVDELCGWGSFSDKIYLADELGAAALFGRTSADHVRALAPRDEHIIPLMPLMTP